MSIRDIAITSIETITAFNVVDGSYLFTLDELQNASINQTQDAQEITGKGGRKITSLKRNKAITVGATNGLVSGGLLEVQTGGKFTKKETEILWVDYLTVAGRTATTTFKAVGTLGAEIDALYVRNQDGTLGKLYKQNSSTATDQFTYTPSSKKISFHTDAPTDFEIVVYYKRRINANTLVNQSDAYSGKAMLYVDALGEDVCSNVYRLQYFIPKADFSGEFSMEMGDNQTTHGFEAEALAGACGAGGNLWTYTVFGVDEQDA